MNIKSLIVAIVISSFLLTCSNSLVFATEENSTEYDLLIITPSEFVSELEPLAAHKESHGIKTKITSLDEIYGNYSGRDEPEQIKYFIKYAKETWKITYVLLVGSLNKTPARFVYPLGALGLLKKYGPSISDLYYADIYDKNGSFCSWDSNNDNRFGEIVYNIVDHVEEIIDKVDLHPDVYIGRLLCYTPSEVDSIVDKIIYYENNTYDKEWFSNIILCGGNEHPLITEISPENIIKSIVRGQSFSAWEGEYIGDTVAQIMSDEFNIKKLYASATRPLLKLFVDAEPLTKKNIKKSFEEGAGFALISAHGYPSGWMTYAPGVFPTRLFYRLPGWAVRGYFISDVKKLDNKDKLPLLVLNICSGGDFSEDTSPIAWEYVKHENGGAIACFAFTSYASVEPGTRSISSKAGNATIQLFEAYSHGADMPGIMLANAINNYLDTQDMSADNFFDDASADYSTLENLILFGDPSLKIGGYE